MKILIKIKKFFNIQNLEQKKLISEQYEEILKIAENDSTLYYLEYSKNDEKYNTTCPICQSKSVVNKIAQVIGSGNVSGNLFGVYGSSSLDTNEVSHCSKCGNQWKKQKTKYKDDDDFIADYLNNLVTHFEGQYTFAEKNYLKLKKYYAETIFKLIKNYGNNCYPSTQETLTLELLRKKFPSIFDNIS